MILFYCPGSWKIDVNRDILLLIGLYEFELYTENTHERPAQRRDTGFFFGPKIEGTPHFCAATGEQDMDFNFVCEIWKIEKGVPR